MYLCVKSFTVKKSRTENIKMGISTQHNLGPIQLCRFKSGLIVEISYIHHILKGRFQSTF